MLTVGVLVWMSLELGLFSYAPVLASDKDPGQPGDPSKVSSAPATPLTDAALEKKAADLALKEKVLNDREAMLDDEAGRSDRVISDLRKQLADKDKEIKSMKADQKRLINAKLGDLKAKLKTAEDEIANIKNSRADAFKGIYDKMDSKKAAKILEDLQASLANQILSGMKADQAAEVLGQMDPDKARELTQWAILKRLPASTPKKGTAAAQASTSDNPLQNLNAGSGQ